MSDRSDPTLEAISLGGVVAIAAYWLAEQAGSGAAPLIALVAVLLAMLGTAYWKARKKR